ncbi:MAG: hypothetical protein HN712_15980 [Gemmatimonadetes bacterium]|nr:hypothetical protein [Gemmatimonadota bacterium]MBT7861816.1 hypothetical protein [Gemmatimonadota bacterium]
MSLKDGLLQLLQVQEVDIELRSLEEAKSQYPTEISQRKAEVERVESSLKELTERLADFERRQRHYERELEEAKGQLKKLEARFSEVKTNREYDALQTEVEAAKARMSEFESQILEMIEGAEGVREQVEIEKTDVDEVRQEQQSRIDELQAKLDSLQGAVDTVQTRRSTAVQGLEPGLMRTYESAKRIRGLTVAAVRKGSCGSCYRQLPAQMRSIVRRAEEIVICESCGAIIVWDEESA